ncbi:putative RNA-directed DNA polymerase from transposon X-element [Trichonephila clavipes]|nr:putative RNA-directed DNA polymerase from transposon X-element [Trichonephila clavipes]
MPMDFVRIASEGTPKGQPNSSVWNAAAFRRVLGRPRDGQVVNTKHLILTFACPDLSQFITAGYLRCSVRPYIPNPFRCFQCQRFGHSKTTCHGKPTRARCGEVGHDSGECNGQEKCINCKGDYPSYSRSCNTWKLEKEIITVKIKNRLTYPEARLAVTNRTPIQGFSYVAVAKKITTSSDELKEKPRKNDSLKIAREADSLYEYTPVSKRSRRRKTSQTSDAMDTDVNPSDTDCVIALQETFLKSCHMAKILRYGCVRKDTEGSSVSGGVCIFTSLDVPSSALSLHTSLQAVAVRIHSTSLFTVCCLYLPPNAVIRQHDLNDLVDQFPAPFIILGDFNGHSTLWGSVKTNPRGRQIEQVLSDHCLSLLNHEEPTYFHEPTRSFHTLDLAICSPSLLPILNFSVEKDLYNSDHFPVVLSHDYDANGKTFTPSWREAIVIPILKPGKVATDPLNYRLIALTSCFCKTFERMINTRLVYVLEKGKLISPLQSRFRKGRSTLDNFVFLESQIRDAFVRRNHLVSLSLT